MNKTCRSVGVLLLLIVTFAWAQPEREFNGTFRYMADAAVFERCDGLSWSVAMQAGYLELERRYLQQASGGDAVFVRLQGRLVMQPDMADRLTEQLEVTKVLELDPNRGTDGCTAQASAYQPALHEGYWQLTALTGFDKDVAEVERIPTLRFSREDAGWQLSGDAACNHLSAPYLTRGERILVGNVTMTQMACVGERAVLEAAFVQVLMRVDSYDIVGDDLILFVDGQRLARLRFSPENPSP